jgi:hypothetical protein
MLCALLFIVIISLCLIIIFMSIDYTKTIDNTQQDKPINIQDGSLIVPVKYNAKPDDNNKDKLLSKYDIEKDMPVDRYEALKRSYEALANASKDKSPFFSSLIKLLLLIPRNATIAELDKLRMIYIPSRDTLTIKGFDNSLLNFYMCRGGPHSLSEHIYYRDIRPIDVGTLSVSEQKVLINLAEELTAHLRFKRINTKGIEISSNDLMYIDIQVNLEHFISRLHQDL